VALSYSERDGQRTAGLEVWDRSPGGEAGIAFLDEAGKVVQRIPAR
jgi:hypothetical protein